MRCAATEPRSTTLQQSPKSTLTSCSAVSTPTSRKLMSASELSPCLHVRDVPHFAHHRQHIIHDNKNTTEYFHTQHRCTNCNIHHSYNYHHTTAVATVLHIKSSPHYVVVSFILYTTLINRRTKAVYELIEEVAREYRKMTQRHASEKIALKDRQNTEFSEVRARFNVQR